MELIKLYRIKFVIALVLLPSLAAAGGLKQLSCNSYSGLIKSFGFTNDWQFLESSGTTAADSIGGNTGTYVGNPTLAQKGPLVTPSKAITLDGVSQRVITANSQAGPDVYTLLAWFKASAPGGALVAFSDAQDALGTDHDRMLYMSDTGHVSFGAWNGGEVDTITGPSFADNNWHMAVATMDGTNGMSLYIDGTLMDSNANTVSQAYTGWWRIGNSTLFGWNYTPTNTYFTGQLGEVAVSNTTALTSAQVQELYSIGTACSGVYTAPTFPAKTLTFSPTTISSVDFACNTLTVTSSWFASGAGTTVNLSSTGSTTTYYSDAYCMVPITSTTIGSGTNTATVYVQDTAAESTTLTASATGYTSATATSTTTVAAFRWTGGGGNANWTTAANWSGGVVPGTSDQAVFTTCASNCNPTINTAVDVGSVLLASNYTGTITQAAGNTFTIENTWRQHGGTFVGGNSTMGGFGLAFMMSGGTFTATSATMQVSDWDIYSGTFNHNNGTVDFVYTSGDHTIYTANQHFYNLTFSGVGDTGHPNYSSDWNAIQVDHNLLLSGTGGGFDNIVVQAYGNVNCTGGGYAGGDGRIEMRGNASGQTITGISTCNFPTIHLEALTNNVALSGTINTHLDWQVNSVGTLTTTGSTLVINDPNPGVVPGSVTYNNVTFTADNPWIWGNMSGGTMTVAGNLIFDGGGKSPSPTLDGGTIAVTGNVTAINNGFGANNGSNSLNVKLTGKPAGQTVTSANAASTIPGLEIAAGANPVTFGPIVSIGESNFTMTSVGTFTVAGNSLYLYSYLINPGTKTYNNVYFEEDLGTRDLGGGTMNVGGNLFLECGDQINNGTVKVSGNFTKSTGVNASGSMLIQMVGATDATISSDNANLPGATFTINKPGQTVTLATDFNYTTGTGQTLTLTAGALNENGKNLIVDGLSLNSTTLTRAAGFLSVGGTQITTSGSMFGGTVNP